MTPITRFTLETHAGPYEKWPRRTRLIVDGVLGAATISGYQLLHQFAVEEGYLLITDFDCMFEEAVVFTLLDPALDTLAEYVEGAPYSTVLLKRVEVLDARRLAVVFYDDDHWVLTLQPPRALQSRLQLGRRVAR